MAISTHYSDSRETLFSPLVAWAHGLREQIAQRRSYRRTLNELSALSAHQLADLGLQRSTLPQTAYQSVYHQYR